MEKNTFGNLRDWAAVLDKLETLSKKGELENVQDELIRLLRYDHNWRLREAAIESLRSVRTPGVALASEVVSLIKRKDLYYDVRILAADCLEKLTRNIVLNGDVDRETIKQFILSITRDLNALLASPEPPKFHDALRISLNRIEKIETAN